MQWIDNDGVWHDDAAPAAPAAPAPAVAQTPITDEQIHTAKLNNQKIVRNKDGTLSSVPLTGAELTANQASLQADQQKAAADALLAPPDAGTGFQVDRTDPGAAVTRPTQQLSTTDVVAASGGYGRQNSFQAPPVTAPAVAPRAAPVAPNLAFSGQTTAMSPTPTPADAPKLDTTELDKLLAGVNQYASQIGALGGDNTGLSESLAQLQRGLEATRSQALSLARSGGPRGRSANEHRALAEGTAAASQASMDAAVLRAKEEDNDRRFKLDALKEAAGLGLNTGALELDVSKVNSQNVMGIINNEFQQLGIDKQLSQQEADSLRGYARDMSAIQFQYDSMTSDEQKFVSEQLLKKYQIDSGLANNLEMARISKPDKVPWWQQALTGAIGGAVGGVAGAATSFLLPAKVSDVRAKTAIDWHAEDDLQELLRNIKPAAYRYKDTTDGAGLFWGPMAQDLMRSKVGASMVASDGTGKLKVDAGRAGLTALGAAAALDERLRRLENG
jgi:hypothetical protein